MKVKVKYTVTLTPAERQALLAILESVDVVDRREWSAMREDVTVERLREALRAAER